MMLAGPKGEAGAEAATFDAEAAEVTAIVAGVTLDCGG